MFSISINGFIFKRFLKDFFHKEFVWVWIPLLPTFSIQDTITHRNSWNLRQQQRLNLHGSKMIFKRLLLKLSTGMYVYFQRKVLQKQTDSCSIGDPLSDIISDICMTREWLENDILRMTREWHIGTERTITLQMLCT